MNKHIVKTLFYLPLIWFASFVIMVTFGCIACAAHASDSFFCGFFCKFGLVLITTATLGYLAYQIFRSNR